MTLLRQCRRTPAIVAVLLAVAAAVGCSTDDPLPECLNCEFWSQVTPGLARFPDVSPVDPHWVVYGTIEKRANAPDANRDSDEDIWLTYFESGSDIATHPKWQITTDTLGDGDNTAPRFSPSGTQIAFAHSTGGGSFEVWRVPITLPADPADPPVTGIPEIVAADARDPAWSTDTRLYFVRNDKIFRVDLPAGSGAPVSAPVQLTFDPPLYASTETFVDRHPTFAPDGGAVFNASGRRGTADVLMKAFEIDDTVFPPDTTETRAWVSYQPPSANAPTYPVFLGADTLRTPRLLRSVPVSRGGTFTLGVRRDSRFLAPSLESYCDTLITVPKVLQSSDVDTLSYYFRVVRGTLRIRSGIRLVDTTWLRADQREGATGRIASAGGTLTYTCLMPFAVQSGQIVPGQPEPYLVRGVRSTLVDSAEVVINPGQTTTVDLFPAAQVTGTVQFPPGTPTPLPAAQVSVRISGTSTSLSSANSSTATGAFAVGEVPRGTFDVAISVPGGGYRDTTFAGVVVTPPANTSLGTIVLTPGPLPRIGAAPEPPVAEVAPVPEHLVFRGSGDRTERGDNPGDIASMFRAEGDASTVWRLEEDPLGRTRLEIGELFGSEFLIQTPAVTDDLGNGLRYVAYVSNATGDWQLFVQRLQDWAADGDPTLVLTPGSSDNLSCVRTVFHPRWIPGRGPGNLALLVALGDCPNNGFEELGIDDNPWAVGELRIWQVELGPGF